MWQQDAPGTRGGGAEGGSADHSLVTEEHKGQSHDPPAPQYGDAQSRSMVCRQAPVLNGQRREELAPNRDLYAQRYEPKVLPARSVCHLRNKTMVQTGETWLPVDVRLL